MFARGDETRDVGHIDHQIGAARIGDFTEFREIDGTGIGAGTRDDKLRLKFHRFLHNGVIIDKAVFSDAVGTDIVIFAGDIDRGAVGQMTAVAQVHAEDSVTGFEQGEERGKVCLCA